MSLKSVPGRVVVSIDLEGKNSWRFESGVVLQLARDINNLNRRETQPVNGIVIDAANIPIGSEILVHQNAATETNRIHDYVNLSGEETSSSVKYFSIPEYHCYIWKNNSGTWMPLPPFETALRVFKPYKGILSGMEPTLLKDTLFVTSGDLKGQVVITDKACDFELVFQDSNGKEGRIIRFRPYGDERDNREPEAIAILNKETKLVQQGKLYVGLNKSDCKPIKELANA